MVLESSVQKAILKYLKQHKFFTFKTIVNNSAGIPDIYALKDGVNIWIEVKRPGGKVSPIQEHIHQKMRENRGIVLVVDSVAELQEQLKFMEEK